MRTGQQVKDGICGAPDGRNKFDTIFKTLFVEELVETNAFTDKGNNLLSHITALTLLGCIKCQHGRGAERRQTTGFQEASHGVGGAHHGARAG